jgi:hypothetical protein
LKKAQEIGHTAKIPEMFLKSILLWFW